MMRRDLSGISEILDYWFMIEFLGQDSYEMTTGASECKSRVKKFRDRMKSGKAKNYKQITDFLMLQEKDLLEERIEETARSLNMPCRGNITVYIGKVKRESCIQKIAQILKPDDDEADRPEKSDDDIVLACFQLTPDREYIPGTLSISTILWALSKITAASGNHLSEYLSKKEYGQDVRDLEKTLFPDDDDPQITAEKIFHILDFLRQTYVDRYLSADEDGRKPFERSCGLKIQYFRDEDAREKMEDDDYLGLSQDFFSEDISMVNSAMKSGAAGQNDGMLRSLQTYIKAAADENGKWPRHDLVHPKEQAQAEELFLKVLNVANAPIGKWPSRYHPAFMQQMAVNLAISEGKQAMAGETGAIFSVNGPPGTGKTTLLKEIVADHIVKKAELLAGYDDPDEAFEKHGFLHGDKDLNAYAKYPNFWYSLRDDRINDYSILVTSCNNAAVKNITEELPIEEGIQSALKSAEADSAKMRSQLEDISELFSVEKASESLSLFKGNKEKGREYKEIYFSGYAKELFGEGAWGLVSVPLGRKKDTGSFYYKVLQQLCWDFSRWNNDKEKRKEKYQKARKEFRTQLGKVREMQETLSGYSKRPITLLEAERRYHTETQKLHEKREELFAQGQETAKKIADHERHAAPLKQECEAAEAAIAKAEDTRQELLQESEAVKNKIITLQEQVVAAEGSVGFFSRLCKTSKYRSAMKLADLYREEVRENERLRSDIQGRISTAETRAQEAQRRKETADDHLWEYERRLQELQRKAYESSVQIDRTNREIAAEKKSCAKEKAKYEAAIREFSDREETQRGVVLDREFLEKLFSDDVQISTAAQTTDPWITDAFNREREKLLYLALQVTREFVLSSNACLGNFTTLGHYWGYKKGDDKERICFHKDDKEAMAGSLLQTLLILVPVVSSTFASVGNFLKDIKEPGVIGTLIIDEAGQAQPQMAVGALYRARKACIVGDPRQVEPVVTDDLQLLKKCYTQDSLRCYKAKSLSVQKFADIMNPFGTYLDSGMGDPEWVGCPLLVHRRCISPMFEISNQISYGNIMKQQTLPPARQKEDGFLFPASQWLNIVGRQTGRKDHYVQAQGKKVCELLNRAFAQSDDPNLYVISPFTSVVRGLKTEIETFCRSHEASPMARNAKRKEWVKDNIATVHKFQGKEADEVIFVLGCDKNTAGAINWVSSNIVNVAVTRAKYRVYIIGDSSAWCVNPYLKEAKAFLDTTALKKLQEVLEEDIPEDEKNSRIRELAVQMPPADSFLAEAETGDDGETVYAVETEGFVSNLNEAAFLSQDLSEEQIKEFGFASAGQLEALPADIRENLTMAMKLYYLLLPVYDLSPGMDASCCGILFCKALELQLRNNFADGLRNRFPDFQISSNGHNVRLQNAQNRDFMMGTIKRILKDNEAAIGLTFLTQGQSAYNADWWRVFNSKLGKCVDKRNKCCHPQLFKWQDLKQLIKNAYQEEANTAQRGAAGRKGVFFESEIGSQL